VVSVVSALAEMVPELKSEVRVVPPFVPDVVVD
jgi:hypothetical protein